MELFTIRQAAKQIGVETHVLRYWEEELGLIIKRNELGHRYYDERDLRLFERIIEMKKTGLSLKEIREGIEMAKKQQAQKENSGQNQAKESGVSVDKGSENMIQEPVKNMVKVVDFKQAQLQAILNKMIANALQENKAIITDSIADSLRAEITSDVMRQFDAVIREKEEREEARFRKLDTYLRKIQQTNEEVAATKLRRKFRP